MTCRTGVGAIALGVVMMLGFGCSSADVLGGVLPPGAFTPEPTQPGATTESVVGIPVGPPTTAKIGAAGGTLESTDKKVKLVVPPGALTADVDLKMTPISNETPLGLGYAVRLEPDGTTFAVPAKLTFAYEEWGTSTVPELLLGATQGADKKWTVANAPVLDTNAKTFTIDLPHFSDWSLSACAKLTASTYVLTGGAEAALAVEEQCEAPATGLVLARPAPTRQPVAWSKKDKQGNAGPGTLTPNGGTATLTGAAPGAAIDPVVRVSAEWTSRSGTRTLFDDIATSSVASFTIEGVSVNAEVAFVITLQGKTSVNITSQSGTLAVAVPLSGIGGASTHPSGGEGFTASATIGDKNYEDQYIVPCTTTIKDMPIRVTVGHANVARQYITGTIDGTFVIQRGEVDCEGGLASNKYENVSVTGAFFAIWANHDAFTPPQQ
jgi:hypothetical protein